jgi:ADP-heptose:LPS heptosyltransferase
MHFQTHKLKKKKRRAQQQQWAREQCFKKAKPWSSLSIVKKEEAVLQCFFASLPQKLLENAMQVLTSSSSTITTNKQQQQQQQCLTTKLDSGKE